MEKLEQIIESFINGQFSQGRRQFSELPLIGQYNLLQKLRTHEFLSDEKKLQYMNIFANELIERIEELER